MYNNRVSPSAGLNGYIFGKLNRDKVKACDAIADMIEGESVLEVNEGAWEDPLVQGEYCPKREMFAF